jgi:hypothetical protein
LYGYKSDFSCIFYDNRSLLSFIPRARRLPMGLLQRTLSLSQ